MEVVSWQISCRPSDAALEGMLKIAGPAVTLSIVLLPVGGYIRFSGRDESEDPTGLTDLSPVRRCARRSPNLEGPEQQAAGPQGNDVPADIGPAVAHLGFVVVGRVVP
jgi:hypothetical protein